MELQLSTLEERIAAWHITKPNPNGLRQTGQLSLFVDEYYNDLKDDFSDELFRIAAKIVQKKVRFFPVVADFFEIRDEALAESNRMSETATGGHLMIQERTGHKTDEEKAQDAKRLDIINKAIAEGTPEAYEKASQQLENMIGWAQ